MLSFQGEYVYVMAVFMIEKIVSFSVQSPY